ncbi:putative DD41D transposase [Trichonephila inaurata madagascariensis]|uniref:Putative DD41D transposase n=1 Tax=Trichonephila inaurata madagascariensis TaxID=2747483 RepID=A0A8X6YND8_9ARAC|nr:putative DD41D transposase [Trichonephila inaurata madagascariensis]
MIIDYFWPELEYMDLDSMWFQQDGATSHTAHVTIDLLKNKFDERVISRNGPVDWPPRSCDLTPLDFFLWGYVKSLVYANKPTTLEELKANIEREIAAVSAEMCGRVMENCPTNRPLQTCPRCPYERSRVPFINVLNVLQPDNKVFEISQMVFILF